ncbi:HAD family phosphatase [Candidatus Bathyarchaeota archaeon]|nr:HAD family phosphatase [Candidatus Bathyarchaeota archaeon]
MAKSLGFKNHLKLVAFDLDGTLTCIDSIWRYLHEALGTWDRASIYAKRYERHEISYEEWARLDVALWKDIPIGRIKELVDRIPYVANAKEAIRILRLRGMKVGVISAGLTILTERASRELELDFAFANALKVQHGRLTGDIEVFVTFDGKGSILRSIREGYGLRAYECAAVGDDETDISLFQEAGTRIAFNPKSPRLEALADVTIRSCDLMEVLRFLGLNEKPIRCYS